jgi:hypothetical protein
MRLGLRLLVAVGVAALADHARAVDTYCPESIAVKESVEKVPEGWKAAQGDAPVQLSGVTFFSGPPEEKASLVYDSWIKRHGLAYGVWHFQPKSGPPIWMSCSYANTSVVLTKPMPAETSECRVTYDPNVLVGGLPEIKGIACR